MKRVIFSLLAVTALSSVAVAADLPRRQVAPAYIPPVFTWTGFYAGINAGYAFNGDNGLKDIRYGLGGYEYSSIDGLGDSYKSDDGGFTGGAQIGYNYQMGSVVLGIEADFNYADLKRKNYAEGYYYYYSDDIAAESKVEWFGTVRPRLGFTPVDRLLVFVTGGLAYGQVKSSAVYTDWATGYSFGGSKTDTRVGWTLGAGLEYAITNNLIVKGEYAYVDLGDKRRTVNGVLASEYVTWKDPVNFHVVRAGLNYKF